ncbi:MAG: hypothetical protein DMG07_08670 [Acidobacteria bacterium]|nr:MAG: hypothetical protein DMG07_08670 [Acidobacteriota bacterium]
MKRMLVALVVLLAVIAIASLVRFEGDVHAVSPQVATTIRDSETWYANPQLVAKDDDLRAVYVVKPDAPGDNRFAAVRVDAAGQQTSASVMLGPQSQFRPFLPAASVRAVVYGLRFQRPAFHVLTFPDGKGPGVHHVDSATGRIEIVLAESGAQRLLLTCWVFNSSNTAEMLSRISADPGGQWIAALSRTSAGWMLYLFPRKRT